MNKEIAKRRKETNGQTSTRLCSMMKIKKRRILCGERKQENKLVLIGLK
jgi:hypothetical protein